MYTVLTRTILYAYLSAISIYVGIFVSLSFVAILLGGYIELSCWIYLFVLILLFQAFSLIRYYTDIDILVPVVCSVYIVHKHTAYFHFPFPFCLLLLLLLIFLWLQLYGFDIQRWEKNWFVRNMSNNASIFIRLAFTYNFICCKYFLYKLYCKTIFDHFTLNVMQLHFNFAKVSHHYNFPFSEKNILYHFYPGRIF